LGRKQAVDMAAPWRDAAACKGEPPELFFPSRGKPEYVSSVLCARCPVWQDCLDFGYGERHGIWGGRRHSERRADLEDEPEPCEGCGDVLPPGRFRWCSQTCAELVPVDQRQAAELPPSQVLQMRLPIDSPRPLSAPLGPTLAHERQVRGQTRAQAAAEVRVTEARWVMWEDGARQPEAEDVWWLAQWLHCTWATAAQIAGLPGPGGPRRIGFPGSGQIRLIP
jgi:WhiB family redox-sensing transcriptional regulator